jgi:hypothetical protein
MAIDDERPPRVIRHDAIVSKQEGARIRLAQGFAQLIYIRLCLHKFERKILDLIV